MPDIYINDPADPNDDVVVNTSAQKSTTNPENENININNNIAVNVDEDLKKRSKHGLEGHSHNPLSALFYMPDNIDFIAREPNEKIVLLLRRHPITNVPWIVLSIIMLFAPAVLSFFPILDFLPPRFQFIAVVLWYLLVVAYFFESFLDWFFSVCIITTERVFDVDFVNLVYREISETSLDHIEDVTVVMGSVIRTIFNFGNVFIQTAAEVENIEFEAVPQPDRVAKVLRQMIDQEDKEKT